MKKEDIFSWLECLGRILLGGVFVYSAFAKIGDPGLFANAVMRYELLPECLVGLFSLTVPMLELLAGLAIVFTKWTRESALIIAGMLVMFIVALAWAVYQGLEIDCGCFGVPSVGGRTELILAIVRDLVLFVPAVWLMFRRNAWIGVRGLVVLAVAVLVFFAASFLSRAKSSGGEAKDAQEVVTAKPEKKAQNPSKARRKKTRRPRDGASNMEWQTKPDGDEGEMDDDDDDDLSPEDKKLKDEIESALDKEDLVATRALASKAMNAASAEVRQDMVDALGNFGVKTLPELTPFLADADEDVRDSAMNEWSVAVSTIENEEEKLGIVELAMNVLSNEDSLESISGEYIGADEKLAVESLLRIIEAGGSKEGIAKAKETYEFVTGEEFTSRADAEKWIAEEYEPPTTDANESK